MSDRLYRAALVGLGNIAWRFDAEREQKDGALTHYGAYAINPRIEVIGGCSPSPSDRESFASHTRLPAYETYEELLSHRPDIVSICSPVNAHCEQVRSCVSCAVPMVWLEKPPVVSLEQLDGLLDASNEQTIVVVNYMRRYWDVYRELRHVISKGELGRVERVEVQYSQGVEQNGSHFIDLMFYLFGDAVTFSVDCLSGGCAMSPSFRLRGVEGVDIVFLGYDVPYHINDVIVTGEEGRVAIMSGGMSCRCETRSENRMFPGFFCLEEGGTMVRDGRGIEQCMPTALNDLIASYEMKCQPLSSLATARGTQQVLEQVLHP